ncbi:MAG: cytochrome b/b6 domain-containing protein, partial [Roseibium sp.]|uniref:cytochrome b n=1 Tax=Roseibium sp. TaxID=1936156 RepID=UPI002617E5E9
SLHWLIAFCVLAALASGYAATRPSDFAISVLQVHLVFGLSAGLFSLIRILIWLAKGPPPPVFHASSRFQSLASGLVHGLLRLLPLVLLASGLGMVVLSGSLSAISNGTLPNLTGFTDLPPRNLHHAAALTLLFLTGLHIAAALWHRSRKSAHAPGST